MNKHPENRDKVKRQKAHAANDLSGSMQPIPKRESAIPIKEKSTHPFLGQWAQKGRLA
jgi:hypothetical protein